jgi:hypothetical protein
MSERTTARLVGWLFIGTFVFSIPGWLLYGPVLDHPDYVLGAGHDTQISLGALLEILTVICNIGTAVALYPLARRYSHRLALGYVTVRVLESTVIVIGIVSVLSVLTLRGQFTGADAGAFSVVAQSLVAVHDWTMLMGPAFCAAIGNGLILGFLMLRSGLLPRRVAMLGPIAGTFAFVAATGALLGVYEPQAGAQILLTVPEMIWELTFGIWLVAMGFTVVSDRRSERTEATRVAAVPALG